jgi:RNA polymerase sigma-70 factor (ECF subfamily)
VRLSYNGRQFLQGNAAMTESVSALLLRARSGDRQALDRLFGLCRSYLLVVAEAQVNSWAGAKFSASDLVQQTLMDAYRGFADFRGGTTAEWLGWLKQIASHNACDLARHYAGTQKRLVKKEVPLDGDGQAAGGPADLPNTPSVLAVLEEQQLLLADAIAQLSSDHREVIVLRNLQGLSFADIAERLGRSRPAVQMLWMRAIESLRDKLAAYRSSST